MKVQELRDKLKSADRERLEKAFAESYKCFSKAQKTEIDELILSILDGTDKKDETGKTKKTVISFENLSSEIDTFLENAYAQNYLAPNRVIPKNQRPKWRFLVKNYLKELQKIKTDDANYELSVNLILKIYEMLCTACSYYLFSTEDEFRSVGISQSELFEILVKRTLHCGYTKEKTSQLLILATTGGLSRESLHEEQEVIFVNNLMTTDIKNAMLDEITQLVVEKTEKLSGFKKYDSKRYYIESNIEELCNVYLMIQIKLAEPKEGIKFFLNHVKTDQKEIALYCALRIVDWLGNENMWILAYQYGIEKRISPRKELKQKYQDLTEKNI